MKILLLLLATTTLVVAQSKRGESDRDQVVKLVLTPKVFYSNAYVLSYERVVKPNQSFSVVGGVLDFPKIFGGSKNFTVNSDVATGYTIGADYRFYLKSENKYGAPRGVYIGPFASYYSFHNDRVIQDKTDPSATPTNLKSDIGFMNIGVQLGYQFVINDRWAIDFIFVGPSLTNYKMKLNLDGNFSVDQENELVKELLERFPLLKDLIDENGVTVHGNNSKWAPGYRFTTMIGYKFGFKKKR